ncbi:hypothetical protein RDWZM_008321 [Blomia tropicalis]|uniref:Uncharacterized protein n=1 Tax=Blomia tropicalis TaxID=40697 RepID=A0A9Q0RJW6_BLOTA|nr:hypothetical protein RDWZM_008321 [Blomia tropicalis]
MRLKERILVLLIVFTCGLMFTFLVTTSNTNNGIDITSQETSSSLLSDAFDASSLYRSALSENVVNPNSRQHWRHSFEHNRESFASPTSVGDRLSESHGDIAGQMLLGNLVDAIAGEVANAIPSGDIGGLPTSKSRGSHNDAAETDDNEMMADDGQERTPPRIHSNAHNDEHERPIVAEPGLPIATYDDADDGADEHTIQSRVNHFPSRTAATNDYDGNMVDAGPEAMRPISDPIRFNSHHDTAEYANQPIGDIGIVRQNRQKKANRKGPRRRNNIGQQQHQHQQQQQQQSLGNNKNIKEGHATEFSESKLPPEMRLNLSLYSLANGNNAIGDGRYQTNEQLQNQTKDNFIDLQRMNELVQLEQSSQNRSTLAAKMKAKWRAHHLKNVNPR